MRGDIAKGYRDWPTDLHLTPESLGEPLTTQGFIRELRDLIMRANERALTPQKLAERGKQLGEKYWPAAADFWQRYLGAMVLQEISAGDSKMRIDPSEIINSAINHLDHHPELLAEEKRQFLDDQRQRNAVEGKIGQGKRRFGLGLIREKLAVTQGSTIALNVLVMNLEKLLELLFVFFTVLLRLLLVKEGGRSIRTIPLKPQIAAA